MSKPTEVDIPILTDIVKPGDADMSRHFDAHCFDEAARQAGIAPDKLEQVLSELLDEMLPAFKQQLLARLQEKLKA